MANVEWRMKLWLRWRGIRVTGCGNSSGWLNFMRHIKRWNIFPMWQWLGVRRLATANYCGHSQCCKNNVVQLNEMTYVCTIKVDINTLDGFVHCTHVACYFLVYMGDEINLVNSWCIGAAVKTIVIMLQHIVQPEPNVYSSIDENVKSICGASIDHWHCVTSSASLRIDL